jgi:hypothetical protein
MAQPKVVIVKRFLYRGKEEEWSNSYSLTGGPVGGDYAGWKTLLDAIIASEKVCYRGSSAIVRGYGYADGALQSSQTIDYVAIGGTLVTGTQAGTGAQAEGDQAITLRAATNKRTVKGKPIYIRKYFHGFIRESSMDYVSTAIMAQLVTHGNKMLDGTLPGAVKWCAPDGSIANRPQASSFITTRTLKRRGRRPNP